MNTYQLYSQYLKADQTSIAHLFKCINKIWYICTMENEILLSIKKNGLFIHDKMKKSQNHFTQWRSLREKMTCCMILLNTIQITGYLEMGLEGNMAWKKAQSIIWKWRKYFVSWCGGLLLVTNLTEFFTLNTKCLFQTNYSLIKCLKNKMQVFFRSKNLYFWAMIQKHLFFWKRFHLHLKKRKLYKKIENLVLLIYNNYIFIIYNK